MAYQVTGEPGGTQPASAPRVAVETNGINVIAEAERKGTPRQLFWPWFGANVSVLGLAYGAFRFGFGVSFRQAVVAGVVQWQGYLLQPFGLGGKDGDWAFANLGVLVALLVGFAGTLLLRRNAVRAQEAA